MEENNFSGLVVPVGQGIYLTKVSCDVTVVFISQALPLMH